MLHIEGDPACRTTPPRVLARLPRGSNIGYAADPNRPRYRWHAPADHGLDDILLRDDAALTFVTLAVTYVTKKKHPPEVHVAPITKPARVPIPRVTDASPAELRAAAELAAAGADAA